jgi:hypothetical protein
MQVLRKTHCLIIVTICGKYFQNPLIYEKVMDWTQNMRMTHRLIITNICAKLFQIPLINEKVLDRTQNIPCNRLC